MPKCAMKNCKNITSRTLKKDGVSYFRFPCDPIQCGEWISIVSQQRQEELFKPNKSSVICSEHFFDEDMYVTPKGIKRLLKTAIPCVEAPDDPEIIKIPEDGGDTENCRTCSMDIENKNELRLPTASPSEDTILDTPQNVLIKKNLYQCRKKIIRRDKIIDNLRKKNSRLVKRNITLKNALKALRKIFKSI